MRRLTSFFLADLRFDLGQIVRSLSHRPSLVAISVLSLALGIGANTALFSVANAVLFDAPPYPEPDRLLRAWETFPAPGGELWTGTVSFPNLEDWSERAQSLHFGSYSQTSVNLTSGGTPERARALQVDGAVFALLGVDAARGRVLGAEDLQGDGRVVVLSDALWRSRYGADPDIVGRSIDLGGEGHLVAGVMPATFDFPPRRETALWKPLIVEEEQRERRGSHWMHVVARLADTASLAQARSEMDAIGAQLASEYPEEQKNRGIRLKTLQETRIGDARPVLFALWAAVGFVLLIACGNVGHLLLARAAGRQREMAVRAALGAHRGRLALHHLFESALLAGIGGLLGLVLGRFAIAALSELPGSGLPRTSDVALDPRVFLYSLAVGFAAALIAGAVPAWRASRVDLRSTLGGSRGDVGTREGTRGVLVVAEVALALVVVLGATLMVRSLMALRSVETGLATDNVLTLRVPVPEDRYASKTELSGAYQRMVDGVASLPGVEAAGLISMLPVQDWGWNGWMSVEGRPPLPEAERPWVEYRVTTPDYFEVMGIPLHQGRVFGPEADAESTPVLLVNETMARLYWGDEDPVGDRIGFGSTPERVGTWWTVLGVVGDVRNAGLTTATRPEVYIPASQAPLDEMCLVVRTHLDPVEMTYEIRRAILTVDPLQPIYQAKTMEEILDDHLSRRRFETTLLLSFAALALLLALSGVYSVMSHEVTTRRSEVGVRMAIGADRPTIIRQFVFRGVRLAVLGAFVGGLLSLAGTRLLESRLFGIEAHDPHTFASCGLTLVLVAAIACLLPAARAASIPPTEALREQ